MNLEFDFLILHFEFVMSENNNIKRFTAADIEKYHKGLLSAKEKNALEKASLDDPFLADALEGYSTAGVYIADDMQELIWEVVSVEPFLS